MGDSSADEESEAEELDSTRNSLKYKGDPPSSARESKRWRQNPEVRWATDEVHEQHPIMSEM